MVPDGDEGGVALAIQRLGSSITVKLPRGIIQVVLGDVFQEFSTEMHGQAAGLASRPADIEDIAQGRTRLGIRLGRLLEAYESLLAMMLS